MQPPELILYRSTPDSMMSSPPLASSLQHFETSLILLSIGRYPHALITCGSAIESALKASINAKPRDRHNLDDLIKAAAQQTPTFTTTTKSQRDRFRRKRNDIVHFGYSPKDDEVSAVLLLETGYRLLQECYESFFAFSLVQQGEEYGGLLVEIGEQLDTAWTVYAKAKQQKQKRPAYCLRGLAHTIRRCMRPAWIPDWQLDMGEDAQDDWVAYEIKLAKKQKLESLLIKEPTWSFDCCMPYCDGIKSFVCALDNELLDDREISIITGACVECDFVIELGQSLLANELFKKSIENDKPEIVSGYGL